MASASIRIDQPNHSTTPYGVIGRARDDLELDEAVELRNGDNSGVTGWRWALLAKPNGSDASLSNPTAPTVTFTPDVEGTYRVRLTVNGGLVGEVATTVAVVRDANGLRIPATEESTEANWLNDDGVPNTAGWWPDVEALLVHLRDGLAEASEGVDDLDTRVTALEAADVTLAASIATEASTRGAADTALDARVDALESSVDEVETAIVYDVDFRTLANNTLVDGAEVIDGLSWTAANIASRTTLAAVANGSGIHITHVTGSTSQLAGGDTAPRLSIPLSTLIPNYNPFRRYVFLVQFSWAVAPDAAGERFSVGVYGAAAAPWPSSSLRFAGATVNYNSTAVAPVIETERDNTILNSQSPTAAVFGFSLDGPTALTGWKAAALPSTLASLIPVSAQRGANLTGGGDYNIFNHPTSNLFVMALAATGAVAVHSVLIERLRIFRV